ncbi:MAG: hypothetical protein A4S09_04650 [Proteobacteria bacterium SG_bin7]|nr:MAG: hypothetical protein A4S09_04650 [Proteobacteria bacterium SG_bin7]
METYQTLMTSDGSPTLIDPKSGQAMHAREGAASETFYIYGQGYLESRKEDVSHSVCVVGLGMGYIELCILGHWLTSFGSDSLPAIHSYESDIKLRDAFTTWLAGKPNGELDLVLKNVSKNFGLMDRDLKDVALNFYATFQWQIHGALSSDTKAPLKFGLICYDPFSSSANPDLWEEDWLDIFVKNFADIKSVFTTYASNGRLKKVLNKCGFSLKNKIGFGMKRESTLAIRN